ncbi:energy-coupling factor transport system permease protein [Methanococcoides vulcani]|uniref:Energy-coupling factor transport system permease protein n=1 Tax=Methanococcoides vulcani TaxID=1353158 RepID=A0A1H9YIQ2_9EURY|nr:energy-coupling factor transporter transmembrane component T [Methanococcoides vulcani]SES68942.1 energy-coupling factor transport system permease protein [Methanococcoides vulcani]
MIRARSISEPTIKDTIIHRMDPRAKIIMLVAVSFIVVALDNPETMLILFLTVLGGFIPAKMPLIKLKTLGFLLLLLIWGTMYSQALFYSQLPRTVIFTIISPDLPFLGWFTHGGLFIYKEGIHYGAVQALRSATVLSLGLLMGWTTDPRDMLNGLVRLKIPYSVAFMVVTAVRFLPIVIAEVATVVAVQRLKGFKPTKFGYGMIKTALGILTPTLANCVRRAGVLAVSIESRAFRANPTRTYLKELRCSNFDIAIITITVSLAIAIISVKILFNLYTSEVYYSTYLREIYAFARWYL